MKTNTPPHVHTNAHARAPPATPPHPAHQEQHDAKQADVSSEEDARDIEGRGGDALLQGRVKRVVAEPRGEGKVRRCAEEHRVHDVDDAEEPLDNVRRHLLDAAGVGEVRVGRVRAQRSSTSPGELLARGRRATMRSTTGQRRGGCTTDQDAPAAEQNAARGEASPDAAAEPPNARRGGWRCGPRCGRGRHCVLLQKADASGRCRRDLRDGMKCTHTGPVSGSFTCCASVVGKQLLLT